MDFQLIFIVVLIFAAISVVGFIVKKVVQFVSFLAIVVAIYCAISYFATGAISFGTFTLLG